MKILVIGATGQTGQLVITQGIALDYEMVAYVRHPEKLTPQAGLTIISGELVDEENLTKSMHTVDAVIVTLGASIKKISEPVLQDNMPHIIRSAQSAKVKRLIILSALGVGQTQYNTIFPYKMMTKFLLGKPFQDHERSEQFLAASELHWTTINPGILINQTKPQRSRQFLAESGNKAPLIPITQRQDVAAALLAVIPKQNTWEQAVIVLSN